LNEKPYPALDKRWIWASTIGFAVFLLVQVFPITGQMFATKTSDVLTRTEAERQALALADAKFGLSPADVGKTTVTHMTDSDTNGYFSKYGYMDEYDKQRSKSAPTDVYLVEVYAKDMPGALALSLNMETGDLVSWRHLKGGSGKGASSGDFAEGGSAARSVRALDYAAHYGVDPGQWEWTGKTTSEGAYEFAARFGSIGESKLWMNIRAPDSYGETASSLPPYLGGYVVYGTSLPPSFVAYMDGQEKWASALSAFGFLLPQVVLFVLAIVYTGTHGGYTSYRRGIFLASVFFVLYAVFTVNMIPGLRAGTWESGITIGDNVNLVVSLVTYAAMALLTYFSAVGGDGLWKSMGRSLWPRWREAGYGEAVKTSMKQGYFLAFILLGAQSVILLLLEKTLGSFASSDATQSMYNMTYPLLLPLLAWCAGISEELQSRLFGIGLFRSWFVGLARKLKGGEPSKRTVAILTTIAIVPPGLFWALGHVGYAVYPVYTRVIELVLMSFLFGWFMLRFGIMTVIFAHVTLDAVLMGLQMMFDGLPWNFAGGTFSLVFPALVGLFIWKLHGATRGRT